MAWKADQKPMQQVQCLERCAAHLLAAITSQISVNDTRIKFSAHLQLVQIRMWHHLRSSGSLHPQAGPPFCTPQHVAHYTPETPWPTASRLQICPLGRFYMWV